MKTFHALRTTAVSWAVETFKKTGVRQWLMAIAIYLILAIILLANVLTERVDLVVGQVAPRDIQATHRVVNRYQTELIREIESERAVREASADPANYVINQATALDAKERVGTAFSLLIGAASTNPASVDSEHVPVDRANDSTPGSPATDPSTTPARPVFSLRELQQLQTEIKNQSNIDLTTAQLSLALSWTPARLFELQSLASDTVSDILLNQRVNEADIPQTLIGMNDRLLELAEQSGIGPLTDAEYTLVTHLAGQTIQPNLVLDLQRVNRFRDTAVREVKPIYVERGQMIVRQFDLVTEEHIQILQDLGMLRERPNYTSALGLLMLLLLLMALFGNYLYQKKSTILENDGHLALLGLILILVTGLAKVASVIPFEGSGYLIPVALATMLIGILLDAHVAIMSALFLSVIVGMVMGQELKFAFVALTSGMAGAFSVSKVGERSALTRAGLWVGLVALATMLGIGLFRAETFLIRYSFLGVLNGLISAVGTIGLFPYLETMFGITSSIRLLELSNPNQPLLRKLLMEAPGTYHHSMIVGNLAEAAAEAIGGDSLITRVGAQYHDIGKTKRPYFFIENQYGGENPHDKIAPSLSTLILTSHVKDGVDLAKQYKLPEVVIDFIKEHHGTTLVRYFYHKAMENAKGEPCDENDFRYPGPKPQTRESAVVFLADSVEAAVRTLNRPTPGRIEGLVRKIIKDYLADGQLDESNLTLRDLDKIADAFVKVLTGIYHKRVEYPEKVLQEMEEKKAQHGQ